jgi:hypothetical protein
MASGYEGETRAGTVRLVRDHVGGGESEFAATNRRYSSSTAAGLQFTLPGWASVHVDL